MGHSSCGFCAYLQDVKSKLPRVFSIGLCGVFIVLAIIFDRINNFFLVYLITTLLLLGPGLQAKGVVSLVQHHGRELVQKIKNRKAAAGKQHWKMQILSLPLFHGIGRPFLGQYSLSRLAPSGDTYLMWISWKMCQTGKVSSYKWTSNHLAYCIRL